MYFSINVNVSPFPFGGIFRFQYAGGVWKICLKHRETIYEHGVSPTKLASSLQTLPCDFWGVLCRQDELFLKWIYVNFMSSICMRILLLPWKNTSIFFGANSELKALQPTITTVWQAICSDVCGAFESFLESSWTGWKYWIILQQIKPQIGSPKKRVVKHMTDIDRLTNWQSIHGIFMV